MRVLAAFLAIVPLVAAVDPVYLQMFTYAYFQGDSRTYKIQDCSYFSWIGSQVASVRLTRGSCLKLYSDNNCKNQNECEGDNGHLAFPNVAQPILCKGLYHNLNSAQTCGTHLSTVQCPNGTFVRRMDFADDYLRSGITIHCYTPGESSAKVTLNTHGKKLQTYSSQYCKGAARGVHIVRNTTYDLISSASALCTFSDNIDADTLQCDKTDALVGLTVVIEELSSVIKSIKPICQYVQDPVQLCTPTDAYQPVVVCDNTQGFTNTQCQYTETIGVGVSHTLTAEETLSLNFYGEFGFGASGGMGDALSLSFSGKLGFSVTTGYDWTQSASSTWNDQISVQVSVEAQPGTITRLEQVVGTCSFYEVCVNYFKRIDTYGNGTTTTNLLSHADVMKLVKVDSNNMNASLSIS